VEQLTGKVAVITGGASGIGLATARRLADDGCRLVLADVEVARLEPAVQALRDGGAEVEGVACDVRHLAEVEALADAAWRRFGAVDIVFNNAGVALTGPVWTMSHEDWRWVLDVDLWGPIHGVEAFVGRMVEQGTGGHVLFTSSFAGLVPNVGLGAYCVAKYGVVALAEVLARELRPHGIGVSVLCPMRVATDIGTSERNRPADLGGAPVPVPEPAADRVLGDDRLAGRVLPVEDVADEVVDAIRSGRLYVLPHEESHDSIRRRFARIERDFHRAPPT
jgi:NAD(P)-dependent dehydrogenase (short-subunit alcohol dehydrogenase family)